MDLLSTFVFTIYFFFCNSSRILYFLNFLVYFWQDYDLEFYLLEFLECVLGS